MAEQMPNNCPFLCAEFGDIAIQGNAQYENEGAAIIHEMDCVEYRPGIESFCWLC